MSNVPSRLLTRRTRPSATHTRCAQRHWRRWMRMVWSVLWRSLSTPNGNSNPIVQTFGGVDTFRFSTRIVPPSCTYGIDRMSFYCPTVRTVETHDTHTPTHIHKTSTRTKNRSCTTAGSSMNDLWATLRKMGLEDRFRWSLIDRWPLHEVRFNTPTFCMFFTKSYACRCVWSDVV